MAFSEPSSQKQWEKRWSDMNFKKNAIWTTLMHLVSFIMRVKNRVIIKFPGESSLLKVSRLLILEIFPVGRLFTSTFTA